MYQNPDMISHCNLYKEIVQGLWVTQYWNYRVSTLHIERQYLIAQYVEEKKMYVFLYLYI